LKKIRILVFVLVGLLLFACGGKEGKEDVKKTEASKEVPKKSLEKGAVLLREPSGKKLTEAPAIIYVYTKGYDKYRYGPVRFEHKKHQDEYKNPKGEKIPCTECHHDYQDGKKNVWKQGDPVRLCVECHNPNKSEGEKKKLQLAFHEDCKSCHEEVVKAGIVKDAPYKKCTDCMGKKE